MQYSTRESAMASPPVSPPPEEVVVDGPEREFTITARSQWKSIVGRFLRHRLAMISMFVFGSLFVASVIGPVLWKYKFDQTLKRPPGTSGSGWLDPSWDHPFGVSRTGYDQLALVMRGLQYSIRIALVVAVVSTVIGVVVGAVSGYFSGRIDQAMMRFVDLMLIIPFQVAVACLQRNVKGSNWLWLALFLAGFSWMGLARIIRGEFLSLREKEFVEAARAVGARPSRIIFRQILPNAVGPIIVSATLAVGGAVIAEAALSFIGLGVKRPDTSLGFLIESGKGEAQTKPYLFWWPVVLLCLISLTINFVGDGLRDAFDPRQNRVRA